MSIFEYNEERQRRFDIKEGIELGEDRLAKLNLLLLKDNRVDDLLRASKDKEYRNKLYKEYDLK